MSKENWIKLVLVIIGIVFIFLAFTANGNTLQDGTVTYDFVWLDFILGLSFLILAVFFRFNSEDNSKDKKTNDSKKDLSKK